jgi:acyl dehydratase
MTVSIRHILQQGPGLRALARFALSALDPRARPPVVAPGPWSEAELPPRPAALVRDYLHNVGADATRYTGLLPAHLFPQWALPLIARDMVGLPWPVAKAVNAGCRLEQHKPLPLGEPLLVRMRLESIEVDDRRALVTYRVVTGTRSSPDALVAEMRLYVPLGARKGNAAKQQPTVPQGAREVAVQSIPAGAGLDFAMLTGDFNPIHWLAPYARAAGFPSCILHGFSTLARAIEAVNSARQAGAAGRIVWFDAKFTRPLPLPARVGVYVTSGGADSDGLWVGDAPGGLAYLEGHFRLDFGRR